MAVHAILVHPLSIKTKLDSLAVKLAQIAPHPYKPVMQSQTVSAMQATQGQTGVIVRHVWLANSRPHQAVTDAQTVLTTLNLTLGHLCASAMLGLLEMAAVARNVLLGNTKRQLGQQHAVNAAIKGLLWQQALL